MTPTEICELLNSAKHDGQIDWRHYQKGAQECYFSRNQLAFNDIGFVLSPLSAEIVAKHYHALAVLKESDREAKQA
jgi:hypothetical protein